MTVSSVGENYDDWLHGHIKKFFGKYPNHTNSKFALEIMEFIKHDGQLASSESMCSLMFFSKNLSFSTWKLLSLLRDYFERLGYVPPIGDLAYDGEDVIALMKDKSKLEKKVDSLEERILQLKDEFDYLNYQHKKLLDKIGKQQ